MNDKKIEDLIQEISDLELTSKKHASRNHTFAYATAILAVAGSIASAIMASFDVQKYFVAIAAIIPAAVTAVTSVLRFEPKSQWFYERLHRLSALRRALEFEAADCKEISNKLSILEQEYQSNWVKFGNNYGQSERKSSVTSSNKDAVSGTES